MTRRPTRTPLAALVALLALPAAAVAQESARPATVISLNPFGLVFELIDVEAEHAFSSSSSAAIGVSHWKNDEERYTAVDFKYKLFPSEHAPEKLAVAATVGYTSVRTTVFDCTISQPSCARSHETAGGPSTGIEVDYTWMLGARKRFTVLLGGGAKRVYFTGDKPAGVSSTLPVFRFTLGHSF